MDAPPGASSGCGRAAGGSPNHCKHRHARGQTEHRNCGSRCPAQANPNVLVTSTEPRGPVQEPRLDDNVTTSVTSRFSPTVKTEVALRDINLPAAVATKGTRVRQDPSLSMTKRANHHAENEVRQRSRNARLTIRCSRFTLFPEVGQRRRNPLPAVRNRPKKRVTNMQLIPFVYEGDLS